MIEALRARPEILAVNLHSALGRFPPQPAAGDDQPGRLPDLPRYLRAFDFAVSAAGYNSFHELAQSELPTLVVVQMTAEMDDQGARARHAEAAGWAIDASGIAAAELPAAIDRITDPEAQRAMRFNARRQPLGNGAGDAAALVAAFAR
ncbi:MAG: glycosyltransferase [Alphaproteobacteria bacterium]